METEVVVTGPNMHFWEKLLGMLAKFERMHGSYSGSVSFANHWIELRLPDVGLIHCPQYWAGCKAKKIEKAEINEQFAMKGIELVQTQWAVPVIFFQQRKTDGYDPVWIIGNSTEFWWATHTLSLELTSAYSRFEMQQHFPRLMGTVAISKWEYQ